MCRAMKIFNENRAKDQHKPSGADLAAQFIYNNLSNFGSIYLQRDDFYDVFLNTSTQLSSQDCMQVSEKRLKVERMENAVGNGGIQLKS